MSTGRQFSVEAEEKKAMLLCNLLNNIILMQLSIIEFYQYDKCEKFCDGLAKIDNILDQSIEAIHELIGNKFVDQSLENKFSLDTFLRQSYRTICFNAGLDCAVELELDCPGAMINVPISDVSSAIIDVVSNYRNSIRGKGIIKIKTNYFFDTNLESEFLDLSISHENQKSRKISDNINVSQKNIFCDHQNQSVNLFSKYSDLDNIKFIFNSEGIVENCVTLRILLAGKSSSIFDINDTRHLTVGERQWKFCLFTNDENLKSNISIFMNKSSDIFTVCANKEEIFSNIISSDFDFYLYDDDAFDSTLSEKILSYINKNKGQAVIFSLKINCPVQIKKYPIFFLKPVNFELFSRTIAAVKIIRCSAPRFDGADLM